MAIDRITELLDTTRLVVAPMGWHVAEALIWCEQPCGRVTLEDEVAEFLPCQGDAAWPSGPIDLGGTPW